MRTEKQKLTGCSKRFGMKVRGCTRVEARSKSFIRLFTSATFATSFWTFWHSDYGNNEGLQKPRSGVRWIARSQPSCRRIPTPCSYISKAFIPLLSGYFLCGQLSPPRCWRAAAARPRATSIKCRFSLAGAEIQLLCFVWAWCFLLGLGRWG